MFSSCCVVDSKDSVGINIYCGSHDKHLYCWNGTYELEWKSEEFDSELYSIPCMTHTRVLTQMELNQLQAPLLFAGTTAGHIYTLNPDNGQVLGKLTLPWDVYSSPVVFEDCIVVGCRDDSVYCFKTTTIRTTH